MSFKSILFKEGQPEKIEEKIPDIFTDLHLDQIVRTVTEGREEYDLNPFFYTVLKRTDEVLYRQDVIKDLENPLIRRPINQFADGMSQMREMLKRLQKSVYNYQKEWFFIAAVSIYCKEVQQLQSNLQKETISSDGLSSFQEFLQGYQKSDAFQKLDKNSKNLLEKLRKVKYNILINDLTVQVLPYREDGDFLKETQELYQKFKTPGAKNYLKDFPFTTEINHVEGQILEGVAILFPELFQGLIGFYRAFQNFRDQTLMNFDREIQFYLAFMDYAEQIKNESTSFCYPEITTSADHIYADDTFDLALAYNLSIEKKEIVCNSFKLTGKERILIISGPNQGGKTTFARMVGQIHYLGALGLPIPGREAKIKLFDAIYTHFEREENIATHLSKFEEDLIRIHNILNSATEDSIIILNEIFSSTTLQDALFLNRNIMKHLKRLNAYCVWVSFIEELTSYSDTAVSMVSTVFPQDPSSRTFKIIRKPADGKAYALSIAEKYGLTYARLKERIP